MRKVLFILQNAYLSDKYKFSNEKEWYKALHKSYTGKKLMKLIPSDCCEYAVINSTPVVGNNASSCFVADLEHLKNKITEIKPDLICACGTVAQKGLEHLGISCYKIPHPAYRAFSSKLAQEIKNEIRKFCTL